MGQWLLIVDREVRGRFATLLAAVTEEERLRSLAPARRMPMTDVVRADWPSCAWLQHQIRELTN